MFDLVPYANPRRRRRTTRRRRPRRYANPAPTTLTFANPKRKRRKSRRVGRRGGHQVCFRVRRRADGTFRNPRAAAAYDNPRRRRRTPPRDSMGRFLPRGRRYANPTRYANEFDGYDNPRRRRRRSRRRYDNPGLVAYDNPRRRRRRVRRRRLPPRSRTTGRFLRRR